MSPDHRYVLVPDHSNATLVPSAITFTKSRRYFGQDAISHYYSTSNDSVLFIHNVFAQNFANHDYLKRTYQSLNISRNSYRNSIALKLNGNMYETEEVFAMVLENVKTNAEKFSGWEIKDCVLTVPSFWGRGKRNGLLQVAKSIDLNPIALINENTAAALQYAVNHYDKGSEKFVIFFNIGASYIQTLLARFSMTSPNGPTGKKYVNTEILGHTSDETIGSSMFASLLVESIVKKIEKKFSTTLQRTTEVMKKIFKASADAIVSLSSENSVKIVIEKIIDSENFECIFTRKEFDSEIEVLLVRISDPIFTLISKTKVTEKQVDSIEMIGGASRIPRIQSLLKQDLGIEVKNSLDPQESIAKGAAFYAVNLTSVAGSKPYWLSDVSTNTYTIRFAGIYDKKWKVESVLFSQFTTLGKRRKFLINSNKNVKVLVEQANGYERSTLLEYKVFGVDEINQEDVSLFFDFYLDYNDVPYLLQVEAKYEVKSEKNDKPPQKMNKILQFNHTDLEVPLALNDEDLEIVKGNLKILKNRDIQADKIKIEKENYHEYVNEVEVKIHSDSFEKFMKTQEKFEIINEIFKYRSWKETDSYENCTLVELKTKRSLIENKLKNITERESESAIRPQVLMESLKKIEKLKEILDKINTTHPWIPSSELVPVLKKFYNVNEWLTTKINEQSALSESDDPIFKCEEIKSKISFIERQVEKLTRITKEKVKVRIIQRNLADSEEYGDESYRRRKKKNKVENTEEGIEDIEKASPKLEL